VFLGIDDNSGLVYESVGSVPDRPVLPIPMVSQAHLIGDPADWAALPASYRGSPQSWLFREDSFDPVTRTRRGRLYQAIKGAGYPQPSVRVMPHPFEDPGGRSTGQDGKLPRPLNIYAAGTELLQLPYRGLGVTLALGNNKSASAWRIIDVEVTVSDDVMLVLRALSSFGLMPPLELSGLDAKWREDVERAVGKVVDSAFRESPIAVVDCCRDAATVVSSRWLAQSSGNEAWLRKELRDLVDRLGGPEKEFVAANAARTIAILHSRGKSNEQANHGVAPPSEDDAEYAIHSVALLLRELGLTRLGL